MGGFVIYLVAEYFLERPIKDRETNYFDLFEKKNKRTE